MGALVALQVGKGYNEGKHTNVSAPPKGVSQAWMEMERWGAGDSEWR